MWGERLASAAGWWCCLSIKVAAEVGAEVEEVAAVVREVECTPRFL